MRKLFLLFSLALTMAATSYATTYGIWVVGKQVTSYNQNDILGDGTISFDPTTNTITMHGGEIYATFQKNSKHQFTYDCGIFIPYQKQSSFTEETSAEYEADVYLKNVVFDIHGDNSLINAWDESKYSYVLHEGIFSRVPTEFKGPGCLRIYNFNKAAVHVKDNVTFTSGRYFFENTLPHDVEEDGHPLIYQEGGDYTLTLGNAFFHLLQDNRYTSAIWFKGKVNSEKMAAVVDFEGFEYKDVTFENSQMVSRQSGYFKRLHSVDIYPKNYNVILLQDGATEATSSWITYDNHMDVNNDGGSVKYDFLNNTLFLDRADIQLGDNILQSYVDDLNIACYGRNTITGKNETYYTLRFSFFPNVNFVSDDRLYHEGYIYGEKQRTYHPTGSDSLSVLAPKALSVNNMHVSDMVLFCKGNQDAFSAVGTVSAVVKQDNGTNATFGKDIYYPIKINREQLSLNNMAKYIEQYGDGFQCDGYTLSLNNVKMSGARIEFLKSNVPLGLTCSGDCQIGELYTETDLCIINSGNLVCMGGQGFVVNDHATLTIMGTGSYDITGGLRAISSDTKDGNVVISHTTLSLTSAQQLKGVGTVQNIQSLLLNKAAITSPSGASFISAQHAICVGGTPTVENVVISPVEGKNPISSVSVSTDKKAVCTGTESATISAFIQGNGALPLRALWQRQDQGGKWQDIGSSISITAGDALNGTTITQTYSPKSDATPIRKYRVIVRSFDPGKVCDTVYSNEVEIAAKYKVALFNGGFSYWKEGEDPTELEWGQDAQIYVATDETYNFALGNECMSSLLGDNFTNFDDLGNGVYRLTGVQDSYGSIHSYRFKFSVYFYSSLEKSAATLLDSHYAGAMDHLECGESINDKGWTIPVPPAKATGWLGWLEEKSGILYTSEQLLSLPLEGTENEQNFIFCALYEGDIVEDDPTSDLWQIVGPADRMTGKKVLINNQVYILYGNKLYNTVGMQF